MSKMLGKQLLVELYGCDRDRLDDVELIEAQCVRAADAMGATVLGVHAHRFQPMGVSVVVVLSESHLALHTWPELAIASLDIFVCSQATNPHYAKCSLAEALKAESSAELELYRGGLDRQSAPPWRPVHQLAGS